MGTYLNPGNGKFLEAVHSEIYVDKSEIILHLNAVLRTEQKYVSVSARAASANPWRRTCSAPIMEKGTADKYLQS